MLDDSVAFDRRVVIPGRAGHGGVFNMLSSIHDIPMCDVYNGQSSLWTFAAQDSKATSSRQVRFMVAGALG